MSVDVASIAGLTALAGLGVNAPELLRKTPGKTSSGAAEADLIQALDNYVNRVSPDNPLDEVRGALTDPSDINLKSLITNSDQLASYSSAIPGERSPGYKINPNADRGLLAHELGHIAFGQTKAGQIAQKLRGASPKVGAALAGAAALSPIVSSALTPGDDDVTTAIMLSTALSAPGIIDEFEASRRGLALLNEAGMKATPGQRARMAGGLLTYLAAPVAIGASGALLGNLVDQDVTLGM